MQRINLDENGGYEKLLEKAISRIPELCPDWQNTRDSDPGITIIQLMAALTDIQNYTVDSVSEKHKEAYIKLLGGAKRSVKCARANVIFESKPELKKGERIRIGRNFFEYSDENMFIQKETIVSCTEFFCNEKKEFPEAKFFRQTGDKIWIPVEKIDENSKAKHRAVFYDGGEILELGETSGITMQEIKLPPKLDDIMPQSLKIWANYGDYYEEIGFNFTETDEIMLGNGRDFPIPKAGGKIEAYSLILTKGATSLSDRQPIFYKNGRIRAEIQVLSEGKNAETADEALLRIGEMLTPKTCVKASDYEKKIKSFCKDEIKKLKVRGCEEFNRIIIYILLNENAKMPFGEYKSKILRKLQPCKLLNVSLEIHEIITIPVKIEGEIALNADNGEIREEIKRTVEELCEKEIGTAINTHILLKKLLQFPQIKSINKLEVKYDRGIKIQENALTYLSDFSFKFLLR